ncbi:hypothetical protein QJQ45_027765, partial [Haematococcus lacustris]
MEFDTDSDSESDCDSELEPQSDSESESEPEPVRHPPQRRWQHRHPMLMPVFENPSSGVWDPQSGQLMADQLRRWKLTKGQVKHASGLNNARRDTERWIAPIKPHLQHLAAASSAGTSLEANLKHITVTLATWDAVWEVYLDPKWARQRLRLYGAQDRALEQFFNKLEEEMAELSMERHNHAKQLVVFFGTATIGTGDSCTPYLLADLPAAGVTVFNISQTTCGTANGWNCRPAPEFLYLLPSSEEGDRSITLDTCVEGVAAWDTVLYVIPVQDGTCGQCSVRGSAGPPASRLCTGTVCLPDAIAINDDSSICGRMTYLSRVTFTAKAGQAYWVVVEGYSASVVDPCTPYLLADLPAAGETVYNNYETTCGTANGWNCRPAPDFLYLLPSSEEGDRSITLDTFVYEYHFWNTLLYVIPVQDGTCGQCSGAIASDDDSSFWDNGLSRVTFTAKAGQAYWVLVEGYSASDVDTCTPYLLADLPAVGETVFNISQTTCDEASHWNCKAAPDFLYLLPSSEEGDRNITLDTCVDAIVAWNTLLYVIPVQNGTCGQCSGVIAANDDSSICGYGLSRVTFTAKAGQAYWVLVEGYSRFDYRACGELSLTVITGPVAPPPPLPPPSPPAPPALDACTPYLLADLPAAGVTLFNISQTTCGTANGWNCRPAPEFLYLLPSSEEGDRNITLDTCVEGVAAWDTVLYVIPVQDGTCGQCSVRGSAGPPPSRLCTGTVCLPGVIAINDNMSICGNGLARVSFTAKAGQAYWVLVEGYSASV